MTRDQFSDPVAVDLVRRQATAGAAFTLACAHSGLEDQEIYRQLGIDAGYFSRMKAGSATLQAGQVGAFCRIVGNTAYPEWIAHQVGCGLVMTRSEAERRADALAAQLDEQRRENRLLRELVQGRATA